MEKSKKKEMYSFIYCPMYQTNEKGKKKMKKKAKKRNYAKKREKERRREKERKLKNSNTT